MIRGLKYFYTNREMYNSVLWQGSEIPTARKSSPAQPSTAHTALSTGFSILCTTEWVPSSSQTLQLWKGTTEMCKIKTGLTKKIKKRLLTISPTTRTRKHKLKHLFTLHTIKLQTHNQGRLWIQRGPDQWAENGANGWFLHSQVNSSEKGPALLCCFLSSFLKFFEVRHSPRCPTDPTHYGNFNAHHSVSWT